jgi:hypothetical protein
MENARHFVAVDGVIGENRTVNPVGLHKGSVVPLHPALVNYFDHHCLLDWLRVSTVLGCRAGGGFVPLCRAVAPIPFINIFLEF